MLWLAAMRSLQLAARAPTCSVRAMRRGLASIWLAVNVGCHSTVAFEPPQVGFIPQSTLLVLEGEALGDRVWAWSGGSEKMPPVTAQANGSMALLYYERSLDVLGLPEGAVELAGRDDETRPLPQPRSGFRAVRQQNELGPWIEVPALDDLFGRIRLPGTDPGENCWAKGGCYATKADVLSRVCTPGCGDRKNAGLVAPPAAPAPIDFMACSSRWGPVSEPGLTYCEPPPLERCDPGFAMWPSLAECTRIGPACPSLNAWPSGLPTDRPLLFVRPGAPGGDGSANAPYSGLQQTIDAAPPDAVIVLAPGTYVDPTIRTTGVTLWGSCVEETVIRATTPLLFTAGRGGLVNLSVFGPRGAVSTTGGQVILRDLDVFGHGFREAIIVNSSSVSIERVRVRGPTEAPEAALSVGGGAQVRASQVSFEDNGQYTLNVQGQGSQLIVEDAWLTAGERIPFSSGAALVQTGAEMKLRSVVISGFRAEGVTIASEGSRLEMLQVDLRNILSPERAVGVSVNAGAHADLSRVRIDGVHGPALQVLGGVVQAERMVISGGRSATEGHILVDRGALDLGLSLLRDSRKWGLRATRSNLTLRDVRIEDVHQGPIVPGGDAYGGVGLWAQDGTSLVAQRLSIKGVASQGLVIQTATAEPTMVVDVQDLRIADVASSGGNSGHGLQLTVELNEEKIRFEFRRTQIETIAGAGVYLLGEVRARMRESRIEGAGYAVRIVDEANLELEQTHIRRARMAGVCARGFCRLKSLRLLVEETVGAQPGSRESNWVCASAQPGLGDGVRVSRGARVTLDTYEIRRSVGTAVITAEPGSLVAHDGLITGNQVGLAVPSEIDLAVILLMTELTDNGTDLVLVGP
jgi:hypothetical protein